MGHLVSIMNRGRIRVLVGIDACVGVGSRDAPFGPIVVVDSHGILVIVTGTPDAVEFVLRLKM